MSYRILFFCTIFSLTGCASYRPVDVAKPSELTIEQAILDVANGLHSFRELDLKKNTNFGLLVDEVSVTLKVTASAKDSTKLVVDASNVKPAILSGGALGINVDQQASSDASKDNSITVKLKHIYTASLNEQGKKAKLAKEGGPVILLRKPIEQKFE